MDTVNSIKKKVHNAFSSVKLEDGIGYFEANAIDDYLTPDSKSYNGEKAKDERNDWQIVLKMIEDWGQYNRAVPCFMDTKGLLFDELEFVLPPYIGNTALLDLLNEEQQKCLLEIYEQEVDYENSVQSYIDYKGSVCSSCGKIHRPVNYTKKEAIKEVESTNEYATWRFLKDYFQLKQ